MGSTLGYFIVNELIYLPPDTEEVTPWTQWAEILTEHRKIQEAYA